MKEEREVCSRCGCLTENLCEVEDEWVCEDCMKDNTFICINCGERFWNEHNAGDRETPLCDDCFYNGEYYMCSQCERVMEEEDAYYIDEDGPYCGACYERKKAEQVIQDYSYKPDPIFYGNERRYFGVELEVDDGGNNNSNARQIMDFINDEAERIYIKNDSSIDDGFEIVTHPMGLQYHKDKMPWKEMCSLVVKMGYISHKTNTCGLHIHVNRDSLGMGEIEEEMTISNILLFMEKFWSELVCFSRRTQNQLDRWARRYGFEKNGMAILDKAKKGYLGRYTSLNLENKETIEFRIFRGSLNPNTILATLELVNEICSIARRMTEEDIQNLSWIEFVRSVSNQKELVQYLKERSLYVNEPVVGEDEK